MESKTEPKVFGVGLSRTGTSSLAAALRILGYSTVHHPTSLEQIVQHDAACDTPVAAGVEMLAYMYPEAKFILTFRNLDIWLSSCERYWRLHLQAQSPQLKLLHQSLYGGPMFCRVGFMRSYVDHHHTMTQWLSKSGHPFLKMSICDGQGWETLCPFLGKPIPSVPFPWENRSQ